MTQDQVKEMFDYVDGNLIWKVKKSSNIKIGSIAGTKNNGGYIQINLKGKNYKVHRLIWLWHYGSFPSKDLDHINGVRDDNRIQNLRECTDLENQQNSKRKKTNTSGYTGVTWNKASKKWRAKIMLNYKQIHLGLFETPEEAYAAYLEAKSKYHTFNPTVRK